MEDLLKPLLLETVIEEEAFHKERLMKCYQPKRL